MNQEIYLDCKGNSYGNKTKDAIYVVSSELWNVYVDTGQGIGWDIIDGVFTPLISEEEALSINQVYIRESERHELYIYADEQISKCYNYILLDIETEKYTRLKLDWLQYKMDVRNTKNQEGYPLEVEYPEKPEDD